MNPLLISSFRRGATMLLCVSGLAFFAGCHTTERAVDGTERVGRKVVHGTGHVIHRTGEGVERVGRGVEHSVQ